ncbi:hypothetical protein HJC23_012523 [Cyclotella cryptica]|uniref:Mitochondrial carrier protein n=1 Tax=Cyclotella cryptica TaxID=29204 RepID=A0ABD3QQL4_9STRA|eukprot:CCRYP_003132-RA/>CCRYP_003132-RA protein AED:0.22 eAED:0.22 QI:298/1/1/1/0.75/0.6/5/829/452
MRESSNSNPVLTQLHTLPKEIRNLLAGGVAGMIAKSFVAPMDRIKIMYQVTSATFRLRDVPKVAMSIVEKEGWTALWKGNGVTMIRVFPYSGIQFMVFDYCKSYILYGKKSKTYRDVAGGPTIAKRNSATKSSSTDAQNSGKAGMTPAESLISGMFAGTVSALCTYPLDLARAQLAVLRKKKPSTTGVGVDASNLLKGQLRQKKGLGYVLSNTFKQRGFTGLYRGITPTLLGILPYSGIAFTINEQAKRQITHICHREPTTMEKMLCGALSGLFAQTLAYPLEVTRRRMQTIGIVPTSGSESAAINLMGVSKLKPSVDELPQGEIVMEQSVKGERINLTTNASSCSANVGGAGDDRVSQSLGKRISEANILRKPHKPPSMLLTMQHLYEEQGMRGFFKGVSMNWIKGPVAFSISFTTFDLLQGWAQTDSERAQRNQLSRTSVQRRLTNNEDI